MHGNVWEWCEDDWHENYEGTPTDGSVWLDNNDNHFLPTKCLRGGSWYGYPSVCRSSYRYWDIPVNDNNLIGFRLVCAVVA